MPYRTTNPPTTQALMRIAASAVDRAEEDIGALAEQLEAAERAWHQASFSFVPSLLCSECAGTCTS